MMATPFDPCLYSGWYQVIPGNDQNMYPTNQKTAGSKLERTSQLMFYGSRRHLKAFQFMRDELKENNKERHSSLHGNDSQISVDDLWTSWKQSEVRNWTEADVIQWLEETVGLPEYKNLFVSNKIIGKLLPRLATDTFLAEIGITNTKHRKKISLRVSDVVLFGAPAKRGFIKDMLLLGFILLSTLACLYAISERKHARKQMEQMMKDADFLQQAEDNLKNMQEKLLSAENEHQCTQERKCKLEKRLQREIVTAKKEAEKLHAEIAQHKEEKIKIALLEQELVEVRKALYKAEKEVEFLSSRSPRELQQWLQLTYRMEAKHYLMRRQAALRQMEEAKEACKKIQKKRGYIFGSFRLAHGQTIDEVDQKILDARAALADVTNQLQERQHRWRQIELICGFQIVSDGLLSHTLEHLQSASGKSSIAGALAVCANLGSIGSIPQSSESGTCKRTLELIRDSSVSSDSDPFAVDIDDELQIAVAGNNNIEENGLKVALPAPPEAGVRPAGSPTTTKKFKREHSDPATYLNQSKSESKDLDESSGINKARPKSLPSSRSAPVFLNGEYHLPEIKTKASSTANPVFAIKEDESGSDYGSVDELIMSMHPTEEVLQNGSPVIPRERTESIEQDENCKIPTSKSQNMVRKRSMSLESSKYTDHSTSFEEFMSNESTNETASTKKRKSKFGKLLSKKRSSDSESMKSDSSSDSLKKSSVLLKLRGK